MSRLRPLAALSLLAAALLSSGCFNPFSPRIGTGVGRSKPPPVPSSAPGVLRLFEWCYNQKAAVEYRELFTDDFEFVFSPVDSAGAPYRGVKFRREDELISTTQLFLGGSADQPPASNIQLTLDKNFFVLRDQDFLETDPLGRWHKTIHTQVLLNITTSDGSLIEVSGAAKFYMVRGDFALIPAELKDRGFGPDSNRWYIRRYDDETVPDVGGGALSPAAPGLYRGAAPLEATRTAEVASWGFVKAFYRRAAGR